jgi:ABC-type glycerol-3-phosphate transport system substrate-binding protein
MSDAAILEEHKSRRDFLCDTARLGAAAALGGNIRVSPELRTVAKEAAPVTLQFWDTFSTAEITLLHQLGAEYMKLHPNVKINFYEIPFAQRTTKVPTAVQTNSLPDILRADYPYQWYLAAAGKLLPLDDYLKDWEMRHAIYPVAWKEVTYKGQIVGIPQDKFTSVFVYNKDKFKRDGVGRFPTTWAELVTACKKMTHSGEYGTAFTFGMGIDWQLWPLILQAGGKVFDVSHGTVRPVMNSPQGVRALQFAVDLATKYKVMPPGVASFQYADVDNALKGGKLGMGVFGSWQIANYREAKVPFEVGIGAWPKGPGGRGTLTATTMYMVMNTSAHQKEAVDLIKWLVNKRNALRWAKTLDHEPIDKLAAANPYFKQPMFKAFAESLPFADTRPPIPRYNAISHAFDVAAQDVVLGKATAKQAMDQVAATTKKILSRGI